MARRRGRDRSSYRQPEIHARAPAASFTISALVSSQQRRVDLEPRTALDTGGGGEVRHALVGLRCTPAGNPDSRNSRARLRR